MSRLPFESRLCGLCLVGRIAASEISSFQHLGPLDYKHTEDCRHHGTQLLDLLSYFMNDAF